MANVHCVDIVQTVRIHTKVGGKNNYWDIYHDANYSDDANYSNDDYFVNSYLDYLQQDNNAVGYNQVDSYNFIHETKTVPPKDVLHDFNYNDYIEIDNGFNITLMRKLTNNDIVNHVREITHDIIHVKFDKIYSYECCKMVVNQFDKIF